MSATLLDRIARRRVTLGFIAGAGVLVLARPTPASWLAGSLVACLGEAIRVWAAGHLEKSREVTSSGPYRFTRHPLYLGSSVMGLGVAVASRSAPAAVLICTYLAVTLAAAIAREEAFLRREFGSEYQTYAAGRARSPRRFSFERVFRNGEHRAWAGLGVAMALLALKAVP